MWLVQAKKQASKRTHVCDEVMLVWVHSGSPRLTPIISNAALNLAFYFSLGFVYVLFFLPIGSCAWLPAFTLSLNSYKWIFVSWDSDGTGEGGTADDLLIIYTSIITYSNKEFMNISLV